MNPVISFLIISGRINFKFTLYRYAKCGCMIYQPEAYPVFLVKAAMAFIEDTEMAAVFSIIRFLGETSDL